MAETNMSTDHLKSNYTNKRVISMTFSYWRKTLSKCQWAALFFKSLSALPTFHRHWLTTVKCMERKICDLYWGFKVREITNYMAAGSDSAYL